MNSVTIKVAIPDEFAFMCEDDQTSPSEVLEGFIRDLCSLPGSHGSDERDYAYEYYRRCGYHWRRNQ